MNKVIETIKNIWRVEDLRSRILLTLLLVAIYRFGSNVTLPGIDPSQLAGLQQQTSEGLMSLLNAFSGGLLRMPQSLHWALCLTSLHLS